VQSAVNPPLIQSARLKHWGAVLIQFALVQVLVQFLSALGGFIVVRTLPKSEYALLAITNSMLSACQALAELGTGIGLRSIGGRVWNQPERFGQLLRTTLRLRRCFTALAIGVGLPITAWLLWHNGAPITLAAALCLALLAGLVPLLGATAWAVSAQLHGEYKRIQKLDLASAGLRLALIVTLSFNYLSALWTVLVGVIANWLQSLTLRKWACAKTGAGVSINTRDRRELLRISLKSLPNTIFFCFQGQITLLILTIVASPTRIADLTALGRLAIIFQVLSVTFTNVLAPRFARCQDPTRLRRLYLLLLGAMIITLAPLTAVAWLWPSPFLWLLGHQYASLQRECGWVVTAGCIGQIGGVMWTLNSSRAWIRIQAPAFIVSVLAVQACAALLLDLRQFHDVLVFNLLTTAAPIPIFAADALIGLRTARLVPCRYLSSQPLSC